MELRNIARVIPLLAAALILALPLAAQAAKPSGAGGGNKVSVTAANPPDAFQGEELDVIVSGSGFDAGSQVSYLVTGTSDDSQVEVLSVQYISSTELKTRIRPKDAALPTEYDIQVQTSSGRKGKGTTLFRVKQNTEACVDTEFPAIAYLVRTDQPKKKGRLQDPPSHNFMLTGDANCVEYALLSDYPWPGGSIKGLKFVVNDGLGLVSWIETTETDSQGVRLERIKGVFFDAPGDGTISPLQPEPVPLHEVVNGAEEDLFLVSHDIRLLEDGTPEIAVIDFSLSSYRNLRILKPTEGTSELVLSGLTHFANSVGTNFRAVGTVRWGPDGESLIFNASAIGLQDDPEWGGIAMVSRSDGTWGYPRMVLVNQEDLVDLLFHAGLSPNGELAYGIRDFRGPKLVRSTGIIDPAGCPQDGCNALDTLTDDQLVRDGEARVWTRAGSLLFTRGESTVLEWNDPDAGIQSNLSIDYTAFFDTSWQ